MRGRVRGREGGREGGSELHVHTRTCIYDCTVYTCTCTLTKVNYLEGQGQNNFLTYTTTRIKGCLWILTHLLQPISHRLIKGVPASKGSQLRSFYCTIPLLR